MIIDARQIADDAEVRGNIIIIGGGAAGITLAIELAKHFTDVVLLESGGLEFEPDTQDLYDGPLLGHDSTALEYSRLRYLGGTTNHWNGHCAAFDPVDFEKIPGKPYSGWPFALDELNPYYERAYHYCELGTYRSTPGYIDQTRSTAARIVESPELDLTEFRFSPPTRFGERFRPELESSRIKVYLHANVTDIVASDGGGSIDRLQVRTLTGRKFKATASAFVLCCGGIENPRILLNCTGTFPNGIGNADDLVGRFFMDHLGLAAGRILPRDENFDFKPMDYQIDREAHAVSRVSFKNTTDTTRRRGACSIILQPDYPVSEGTQEAMDSPAFKAFQGLVRDARFRQFPPGTGNLGCIALDDLPAVTAGLYYRVTTRLRPPSLKAITVDLEGEQSPNPSSRVVLTDKVDALGMKKAGLDWRIIAEDRDNLYQTAMTFAQGVGASGFGRMIVSIEAGNDQSLITTTWHHMGTTRMHDDKRQGVVERNCRVHGLGNLFIAGSSVFPTSSRVNPTLTIIALAIRLADHLKREVKNT